MSTSSDNGQVTPQAIGVRIAGNLLRISLNDGRELKVWVDQAPWLKWLSGAPPINKSAGQLSRKDSLFIGKTWMTASR